MEDMRGGGMNYGNTGTATPTALDPLTGEPTSGDYVFQVKFTVILGQVPKAGEAAPAAPAPQRAEYDPRAMPER
jgi:hypothetical protein